MNVDLPTPVSPKSNTLISVFCGNNEAGWEILDDVVDNGGGVEDLRGGIGGGDGDLCREFKSDGTEFVRTGRGVISKIDKFTYSFNSARFQIVGSHNYQSIGFSIRRKILGHISLSTEKQTLPFLSNRISYLQ